MHYTILYILFIYLYGLLSIICYIYSVCYIVPYLYMMLVVIFLFHRVSFEPGSCLLEAEIGLPNGEKDTLKVLSKEGLPAVVAKFCKQHHVEEREAHLVAWLTQQARCFNRQC